MNLQKNNATKNFDLKVDIYPHIDKQKLLKDLNPKRHSGYYELDCPECSKRSAYCYDNANTIICNKKNSCGKEITFWDYLKNKGLSQSDVFKELAHLANINLELTDDQIKEYEYRNQKQRIINSTFSFYRNQLWSDSGKHIRDYLTKNRGYSESDILNMRLGFNPGYEKTRENLFNNENILADDLKKTLNFIEHRNEYPIVFEYRDINGNILSLWGRTLNLDIENSKKYKPFSETKKQHPFYLDKANSNHIVIVEGFFDPMIAHAKGLKNVISIGGNNLSSDHVNSIKSKKIKRVFLALDNDKSGYEGTEGAIKLLIQNDIEVFVVPYPENFKDPDEYIKKSEGIELFAGDITNSVSGLKWLSERILKEHNIQSDLGMQDARNKALLTASFINNTMLKEDFFNQIAQPLGITKEHINNLTIQAKKDDQNKKFKTECEAYIEKCAKLIKEERLEELSQLKKPEITLKTQALEIKFIHEKTVNYFNTPAPKMPTLINGVKNTNIVPFIRKGIVAMLVGAGGVGKTQWLTQLAFSVASGEDFFKKFSVAKKEGGYVFQLCGEDDEEDIHRILEKTSKLYKPESSKIAQHKWAITSVKGKDASFINNRGELTIYFNNLLEYLKINEPEEGWDLIILDPISRFLGPDAENDNSKATLFISALEKFTIELKGKPTVFLGHHMNKSGFNSEETNQTAGRGSSALTDGCRLQINLDKVDNIDKSKNTDKWDKNKVRVKPVKSNHTAIFDAFVLEKNINGCLELIEEVSNYNNIRK